MNKCPNKAKNLQECNCTYASCARKGLCCECIAYHRGNNQMPACFFPPEIERGYDRSVENFIRINK